MTDHDALAVLDETDFGLIEIMQNEFVFTGAANHESSLMAHALRGNLSLREGIAHLTGQMRRRLRVDTLILGLSPELLGCHHLLVLPDYRFGASSRVHEGRHYILFNAGCMNLLSYLSEIRILFSRLSQSTATLAGRELAAWLMEDAHDLALAYLHRPFQLPHLRRYFDDDMTGEECAVLATAELFVYFHEAGHIELGHLGSGFGQSEQERSLPDGAEEFAADRFAMEKILGCNPDGPIGAYLLEELFVLEMHGYCQPPGAVAYRDRLAALMQSYPENFLQPQLPAPAPRSIMPWEQPGFDVHKATRQLYWTCDQAAKLLAIEVPEQRAAGESMISRSADLIDKSLHHHSRVELAETMLALIKAGRDLDTLRAFVRKNPIVLSDEADAWLGVAISNAETSEWKVLLGANRVYLQRCREAGVENVWPIKFALQALSEAASLDLQFDILRAQPHLLSDESCAYIQMHCNAFKQEGDSVGAGALGFMGGLIKQCRKMGLDACLEYRRNVPLLPEEVWQLVYALDTAEHNGDIMRQIRICNEAIALADQEPGVPTWSLHFRERLQQLPQF